LRPGYDFAGKRVLVIGLARTGEVVSVFAAGYGAAVTATDEKPESELMPIAAKLRKLGIRLELGGHPPDLYLEKDLVVVSPGVPSNLPLLVNARKAGIPVWSEVELAWRFLRGKLVAITGSNGKTTTTALTAHILNTAGLEAFVGGNIGTPLLSLVESSTDSSVTVAELSSFQLENVEAFHPEIGVLLNLTPDHLDRYASFEEYTATKMRLFSNQLDRDCAVLNADDPEITKRMPSGQQLFWFSRQKRVAAGAFLREGQLIFRSEGDEVSLARGEDIPLRGEHNVENVLAACSAAYLAGADPAAIANGVKTFGGIEHRLEFVAEISGVEFFNDSKATNVEAARKAIEAIPGPLIVILGGKDKGSPYTPLVGPLKQRARTAILIGAAAEKIAADFGHLVPYVHGETLDRAVQLAISAAQPGDTVLLAPACSSFDQFVNYEHRGRVFKQLVRSAAERCASGAPLRNVQQKG